MISIDGFPLFSERDTLHNLSKDTASDPVAYMTDSDWSAVSFDRVKTKYMNDLGLSEENAKSVDALLQNEKETVFIEFKNGKTSNISKSIKDKVRDSVLMFTDITKCDLEYLRKNVSLVVVYNEDNDKARLEVSKGILALGNEELIRFDLERYKNFLFKRVHTYTKAEFSNYLNSIGS